MKIICIIKYLSQVKNYDDYTFSHSMNTAFYCMLISKWMKMSESKLKWRYRQGCCMISGKRDIPKEILNKKGILTAREFELIKKHTIYGYNKVKVLMIVIQFLKKLKMQYCCTMRGLTVQVYPFRKIAEI